jgi:hypothetical protein
MPNELMWTSAADQADLVRKGEVTARELVEAHGGTVALDNPDGGGARVRLRFPGA